MRAESVVIGLGKTADSCVRYWQACGALPCVMDTRACPEGYDAFVARHPDVAVLCGDLDMVRLQQAKQVVMSPGLSMYHPAIIAAKAQGIQIQSDIDIFIARAQAPIIAITGSNGKSTVTTLTVALLQAHGLQVYAGANLGRPVLDLLQDDVPDVYVLELSSFQLAISGDLPLHAACVLNVSEDHLDWHGSYQAYVEAKQSIYQHTTHSVINRADAATMPKDDKVAVTFALDKPSFPSWGIQTMADGTYLMHGDRCLMATQALAVWGEHQWLNVLAACALADTMAVPFEVMRHVLKTFSGLPHRCQAVRQARGVTWYNDSKGTNPAAAIMALRAVTLLTEGKIVVLLGGLAKDADFSVLGSLIASLGVTAIVYGQAADTIAAAMPDGVSCVVLAHLQEAVALAASLAQSGDAVLLSPACASWDQFDNYQQRGLLFEQWVEALQ